jgi:blue copper oxidase
MKYSWILFFSLLIHFNLTAEALLIPPLLEGPDIELTMQKGQLELPGGSSPSFGYNGDYLGPTLRFTRGQSADVKVLNKLGEETTLHWHGMHIPAEFDGGPHQVISKGDLWNPRFLINQNAATLWYHPHLMGSTAEHVYKGLAGMVIIEDEFSKSLPIPQIYGIDDIPLILQDRRLNRGGKFEYAPGMHDIMNGYTGNVLLVNGQIEPDFKIEGGLIRFRILNGSNSSLMRIRFDDGRNFRVIASDGGFLPESVEMNELIMSPGERFEILVDFSKAGGSQILADLYGSSSFKALQISSEGKKAAAFNPGSTNRPFSIKGESNAKTKRQFLMETRGMRGFSINGRTMDMKRIDFAALRGETEIWTVKNVRQGMMNVVHSFHVHDVQFRILDINGTPPPPHLSGPKDTVLLMPGDTVRIALVFEDYQGIYMYHCHFLEHEDNGMMGQFEVVP